MTHTVLVTGASSGFGRLTVETLARAGHRVFGGYRTPFGANRSVALELQKRNVEVLDLDVTSQRSVDQAVAELLEKSGGRLDVVVNNAGIASAGLSEGFTAEQVRDLFDVNVFGVQRVLRAALPTLRKQSSGLVINIGSILGRVTIPFFGHYGASKAAIEALSDSYRYELATLGVDLVVVQPSAHPTNMYATAQQPANTELMGAYGTVAEYPAKVLGAFQTLFANEGAPKPQAVADAVAKLVVTPAGQRPERVVVGLPFGTDAINAAVKPIQRGVIESLGLTVLAQLAARRSAGSSST